MIVYALVLVGLAAFLLTHRNRPFLTMSVPTPELASNMLLTSILIIVCAIVCIVAGIIVSKMLALIAITVSVIFVGIFGFSILSAMN
ncbi:hypothetical protein FC18_GL002186 [Lacticaseibacillus sharpeae JCM 1186 = DSM 20505]|uniref:Uncharacterized protein n=2 Tax=Lacticaseibacillus sharpeae TaxID=1626 RepID=A0A0R1ZUV4_9LACO|nr:hypothetical protein FC18_GL002186 [Lacticaseibacillus sharpeae JCM 1186 = DSM 20505]